MLTLIALLAAADRASMTIRASATIVAGSRIGATQVADPRSPLEIRRAGRDPATKTPLRLVEYQ